MPKKKLPAKHKKPMSYGRSTLKISKITCIIGYVSLILPTYTAIYLIVTKVIGQRLRLVGFFGRLAYIGLITSPFFLIISLITGIVLFYRRRFTKSQEIKRRYTITAIMIIIIAALCSFYIYSFVNGLNISISG